MSKIDEKRYKIVLQRFKEVANVAKPNSTAKKENATLGKLSVLDTKDKDKVLFKCFTLENGGASTDISGQDKRIVSRDYALEWTDSARNGNLAKKYPKFKRGARNTAIWLNCDWILPKFRARRILIHIGNYPQDTAGCILLGKSCNEKQGWISNSVECVREFYELLEKIDIKNCYLRILEC